MRYSHMTVVSTVIVGIMVACIAMARFVFTRSISMSKILAVAGLLALIFVFMVVRNNMLSCCI